MEKTRLTAWEARKIARDAGAAQRVEALLDKCLGQVRTMADAGNLLLVFKVPPEDMQELRDALTSLNYRVCYAPGEGALEIRW